MSQAADDLAAELDDEEVDSVLKNNGTEPFEQTGEAFLLEDGVEAICHSFVSGQDGGDLNARVEVVNDAPGALEVETMEHRLQRIEDDICHKVTCQACCLGLVL